MDGPDVGKILVDNISLSHPQEPEGRRKRRLLIAYKLGLVAKYDNEKKNIDWKSLQGISCRVDVVHKTYKGRVFPMVNKYQLAHKQ